MKNITKLIGNLTRAHSAKVPLVITALVAVIGFSFAACDNGGGPPPTPTPTPTPTPDDLSDFVTYTGVDSDGYSYVLIIEDSGAARAAYTPKEDDKYTLLVGTGVSTGTVKSFTEGVLTLAPKENPAETFTATVSGANITAVDEFTYDTGSKGAPATLTPPSTSKDSEKSIAIIGITGLEGAYGGSIQDGGEVIAGYTNAEIINGVFFTSLVTVSTPREYYTGSGSFSVVLGKDKEWYITKEKIDINQAVTVIPWSDFKVWD